MGLTCHQDQFYLSERCHTYTLPLQCQSTKSSIGWYKKLPCKESQKEILPLNYQTCMDKFDISTIVFARHLCYAKQLPKHQRLAGNCQEVCCQTYINVVPYEIQAGDRCLPPRPAFTPSRTGKKRATLKPKAFRKETHWNWGGIPWIKHGGSYHYTVDIIYI